MKVLIVNTHNNMGGAARAARRLYEGLNETQVKVIYYSKEEQNKLRNVVLKAKQRIKMFFDKLPIKLYRSRKQIPFSFSWLPGTSLTHAVEMYSPDIIHLHWVNGGFVDIRELSILKLPIVWSIHDMWPFTGGCHYAGYCEKFIENCGNCHALGSKSNFDISTIQMNLKRIHYKSANIKVVASSRWMRRKIEKSTVLKSKPIVILPNPIDTREFSPIDCNKVRRKFNFPKNKKIVLFGAMDATADPRKGYVYLEKALSQLNPDNTVAVVFGSKDCCVTSIGEMQTYFMGPIGSNRTLVELYSAADVMVVPSLEENLSLSVVESMACGTPVVAFRIGGNPDMIEHKKNGYLVDMISETELANGIRWILEQPEDVSIRKNARASAVEKYSKEVIIPKYIDFYHSIITQ